MNTYTDRAVAIAREIVEPLEAGIVDSAEDSYDVEAIADEVLGDYSQGYSLRQDVDFWEVVERHAL